MAVLGLLGALAFLWGRGRQTWYWTDEGLSLGIASHPLAQIPELLAQDTSPPLYHVLLHGWMRLFGSSEASTHSLSLLFALAVVPAALWAGWSLFDRRTGWMCALVAAVNPFLATYANETRMYSLVALLSVLVTATFLHVFVRRRRGLLPAFVILTALTLYTHYWGFFLVLGAGAALGVLLIEATDRRRLVTDGALAFGGVGLLFAPLVPTLLYQRAHSAVGWALPPTIEVVRNDVVELLGGPVPAVALALGAGAALAVMLRRPWDATAVLVVAAIVIGTVAVAAGWAATRSNSQWHFRYLGIVLAPLVLVLGAGLARAGQTAVAALAIVAVLSGPIGVKVPLDDKSNEKGWVQQASPLLRSDDVVFAPIGEVPLLAHYLPGGLRYATTTGPVADPLAADWRDAFERLVRSDPIATVSPLVDSLGVGGHMLVSCPPAEGYDLGALPAYIQLEIRRCLEAKDYLLSHPALRIEVALRYPVRSSSPVKSHLLTKLPTSP